MKKRNLKKKYQHYMNKYIFEPVIYLTNNLNINTSKWHCVLSGGTQCRNLWKYFFIICDIVVNFNKLLSMFKFSFILRTTTPFTVVFNVMIRRKSI